MTDQTLAIREAMVIQMIATPLLTALVPADSIYGERVPDDRTYPFIRTGEQTKLPFSLGCGEDGAAHSLTIHAFVNAPASDDAAYVGGAIREAFKAGSIEVDGKRFVAVWQSGGLIRDPDEPDVWHAYEDYTVV